MHRTSRLLVSATHRRTDRRHGGRGGMRTARGGVVLVATILLLIAGLVTTRALAAPADCLGAAVTIAGATDGSDTLSGSAGDDVIAGGGGDDTIDGGGGNDTICGNQGNDAIAGGNGDDVIFGEEAAILFTGGVDSIDGGDGVDLIFGGPGDDGIDGGSGADIALYALATSPVSVNLGTLEVSGGEGADQLSAIEGVVGSVGEDELIGDGGDNLLAGLGGADILQGEGGFDLAVFLTLDDPGFGIFASLEDRGATGESGDGRDELYGFEGLVGTDEEVGDILVGSRRSDLLMGGGGPDILNGRGGIDLMLGDAGNDRIAGQGGDDLVSGGLGRDRVTGGTGAQDIATYAYAEVPVDASLARHEVLGEGRDRLRSVEGLQGSPLGDTLEGDVGPNVLLGEGGDDDIFGRDGTDFLDGGNGIDDLSGGLGADRCVNGETLTGCELEATAEPPTPTRSTEVQVPPSRIGTDQGIGQVLNPSVSLRRGSILKFPTFCQRETGGYSILGDMPIGVPMIRQTSGFDAQTVYYRGVLYHGGQYTGVVSNWYYTDLDENTPTSTSTWNRLLDGSAGNWRVRYPIDASGSWSVQAELWWWDDQRGWLDPDGFALIPLHRDFDGVYRNTYCSQQFNTAVVMTGSVFGIGFNFFDRTGELF
jgi:hypothetical protein